MFLHDINSLDCENTEALVGARKSVALFKYLPQIVGPPCLFIYLTFISHADARIACIRCRLLCGGYMGYDGPNARQGDAPTTHSG